MLRKLMAVMVWAAGIGAAGAVSTSLPEGAALWSESTGSAQLKRGGQLADSAWEALEVGQAGRAIELLDAETDPLARESAVSEVLSMLQAAEPRADALPLLQWAAEQPVLVFRQHEETRAEAYLPMFDVAQRARDVRRLWAEATDRAEWATRWTQDPGAALALAIGSDAEAQQRAAEAFGSLPPSEWMLAAAVLSVAKHADSPVPATIWLAAAERHPNREALEAALEVGSAQQRMRAIELSQGLALAEAAAVLSRWEPDAEVGSAATMRLVSRMIGEGEYDGVRARLAHAQRRDSAASAIARLASDPERMVSLDALHGGLSKQAEWAGWRRVLVLLEDPSKRSRWAVPAEVQP